MAAASKSFVIAASVGSVCVAVVISELIRRRGKKKIEDLLGMERVVTPAGHGIMPLSTVGIERRGSVESMASDGPISAQRRRRSTWGGAATVGVPRNHSDPQTPADETQPSFRHTEDAALRALNVNLMDRGRTLNPRAVGQMSGPRKTRVVRIALTGGPCAGKSSALEHLIEQATAEGFDVLTAPEVATLYLNTGYSFPSASSNTFKEQKFAFQSNILKLQLQLERCYSDLAGSTGRPTIVVFDRGLRDCRAFMSEDEWPRALEQINKELPNGPVGRITDDYVMKRYDGVIHLVTAADGAEEHYKFGIVEDDSGGRVYRRETPAEAIEQDKKLQEAWQDHPHHVLVSNDDTRGFQAKLEEATEAVLAIARLVHPTEMRRAKNIASERQSSVPPNATSGASAS